MRESAWHRGWEDAARFRKTGAFFWCVEVVGAASFAIVGNLVAPAGASKAQAAVYPGVGVVLGFIAAYAIILLVTIVLAPLHQRNEAWDELAQLQTNRPNLEIRVTSGWGQREVSDGVEVFMNEVRITNREPHKLSLTIKGQFFVEGIGAILSEPEGMEVYPTVGVNQYQNWPLNIDPQSSVIGRLAFRLYLPRETDLTTLSVDMDKSKFRIEEHISGWSGTESFDFQPKELIMNPVQKHEQSP